MSLRVAYLVADLGISYFGTKGASIHVRAITEALSQLGHEVVCFTAREGGPPDSACPVEVRTVHLDAFLGGLTSEIGRSGRNPERSALRRKEAVGLCLNDSFQHAVEEEHRRRPFDLLLERYSLWSFAGARLGDTLSLPFLLEVNAPLPEEQRRFRTLGLGSIAHAVRREVFRAASGVVAVSEEIAQMAVREGARPATVAVVPNGYDPAHLAARPRSRRSSNGFTVGFLGSLKPWHGVEILCEAFASFARARPDARLLLVGDGPLREWVESFASRERLGDRIELVGSVPHREVAEHLARFDLAVAPYPEVQGFYFSPLKVFEYMGAGLPVVASGIGQVNMVLDHGVTGWLVPPGDTESLAGAMAALAADPSLCASLGSAAAQAARGFRWVDAARKVIRLAELVAPATETSHA